jgi:UDP-GlcNAc3NAcA epimerase
MLRVMTIVGARPQFIKAAALGRRLRELPALAAEIGEILVHTGQHFDRNMSDVFFEELGIPEPDANLGVEGGRHGQSTGRMLEAIETEILDRTPDVVLVYGDTNSTLAGALAAAKLHVPVAHVEAGLRSFNMAMPEEINRRMTDHISTLLFCPTAASVENLAREGVTEGVRRVGDVMFDVFARLAQKSAPPPLRAPYALMTLHRAENTDDPSRLRGFIEGISGLGLKVYFPVHPRTRQALEREGVALPANVVAAEPAGYLDLLGALKGCAFVITDSGGLQKEAYFAGKRCVTLRDQTEWVELMETGANRLAPPRPAAIKEAADWAAAGGAPQTALYGDGDASQAIWRAILEVFASNRRAAGRGA